jgi:hypothetical protein
VSISSNAARGWTNSGALLRPAYIEGAAVQDQHSITLRDQALAGLEKANPNLHISFTLPVLPTGLVASGLTRCRTPSKTASVSTWSTS